MHANLPLHHHFNNMPFTWIDKKGNWMESSGNLTNTTTGKSIVNAPIGSCSICTIDTDVQVATANTSLIVLGWQNNVQLKAIEAKDKWQLIVQSGSQKF